jgi:hypothetical protein
MKIKIETKDNKLFKEKEYDSCAEYKELEFWNLYCKLYSVTNTELKYSTISLLAHILTHDPNRSLFADYSDKELGSIFNTSRVQLFRMRTELIEKGILISEDINREYMLNKQFSSLQKRVKQLVETGNLSSIQLNFNCNIQ